MSLKIICSTSTSLFGMRPLQKGDFRILNANGIRHLEVTLRHKFTNPRNSEHLRALIWARENGLAVIHSGHADWDPGLDISSPDPRLRANAIAEKITCLKVVALLGGKMLVLHPSWHPMRKNDERARIGWAREGLIQLTEYARKLGVKLAPEVLAPPCLPYNARQMLELLEGTDPAWVGVCYDVNHGNLSGDPSDEIRLLGSRLIHFHISDNDGKQERHWMPFAGVIDWRAVMTAIRDIGYSGALNFEVGMAPFHDGTTIESSLEMRARVFNKLLELGGFVLN